jgi:hypothetical protein
VSSLLGICLVLGASVKADANTVPVFVPGSHITLAWTHSIEKVRWEEDYVVGVNPSPTTPPILYAVKARVRGSAAGMEPPDDAVLKDGWYEYTPQIEQTRELRLTRSEFTADYEVCHGTSCQPMSHWLPSDQGITLMTPCSAPKTLLIR